jgi:sugar phosphate isomerase/epimerase
MNVSVMAYSFSRALETAELSLPEVVRRVHLLGVHGLELMDSLVREEELPALRKALAETGTNIVCYDLFCDVIAPTPGERRERTARFQARLRQAADLGACLVMAIPGLTLGSTDPGQTRKWFCEALRESLPVAGRLGLTLTVENLGILADLYGRSEQILGICEAVGPELKVTFDAGNFLLAGEDSLEALDRLAPRVAHVHFKDWKVVPVGTPCAYPGVDGRHYQGTALGDGQVNLPGAVRRLKQLGYQGTVSVEYEGPADAEQAVQRGVAYLRTLLGAAGPDR